MQLSYSKNKMCKNFEISSYNLFFNLLSPCKYLSNLFLLVKYGIFPIDFLHFHSNANLAYNHQTLTHHTNVAEQNHGELFKTSSKNIQKFCSSVNFKYVVSLIQGCGFLLLNFLYIYTTVFILLLTGMINCVSFQKLLYHCLCDYYF